MSCKDFRTDKVPLKNISQLLWKGYKGFLNHITRSRAKEIFNDSEFEFCFNNDSLVGFIAYRKENDVVTIDEAVCLSNNSFDLLKMWKKAIAGSKKVIAETHPDNTKIINFFKNVGFTYNDSENNYILERK